MKYRRIGSSGLKVSVIGLGGNNFGARADEETSVKIINDALEMGINFIDTAEEQIEFFTSSAHVDEEIFMKEQEGLAVDYS